MAHESDTLIYIMGRYIDKFKMNDEDAAGLKMTIIKAMLIGSRLSKDEIKKFTEILDNSLSSSIKHHLGKGPTL